MVEYSARATDINDRTAGLRPIANEADQWVRLLDRATEEHRAAGRRIRSMAAKIDEEEATLLGLLIDIAETDEQASVSVVDGSDHLARIDSVGVDVVILITSLGRRLLVPLRQIVGVETPSKRTRPLSGQREPAEIGLASLLFAYAPLRPEVSLRRTGRTDQVRGRLWSCGRNVCTIRTDDARLVHIPIDAIAEVRVHDA